MTARLLFFEAIWSVIYLLLPLALRGRIRASAIRLPQCLIWMGTLLLLPRCSYFLMSLAFLGLLGCVFLEGLYIALGFSDFDDSWDDSTKTQFWATLGLYIAEVTVDTLSALLLGPLIIFLHRLETHPEPAAADAPAVGMAELVVVDGRPASDSAPPAAAPPEVVHQDSNEPLATVPEFRCPITLSVMRDPVIAADGHSYEREALEAWLRSHRTSPLTGARLEHMHVTPNHRLRSLIESAREGTAQAHVPDS